jgi:hypothetical protein
MTGTAKAAGFRDLNWGENVATIEGMKHIGTDPGYAGGIELYVRPKDVLEFGEARLDTIIYKFWKNRFFGVTILVNHFANYTALKETIQKEFGRGWRPYPFSESYMWFAPPTRIHLDYNESIDKGRLALYSSQLLKETEAFNAKKSDGSPPPGL